MSFLLKKNKKNVLVTGSNGFIGTYLSRSLEDEYNVFNLKLCRGKCTDKNEIIFDLRDKSKTRKYFISFSKKFVINAVVHLASRLASADGIEDISILIDNLRIIESLAEMAKILMPRKIINFSSTAVYPNRYGTYNESSQVRPAVNFDCLYGLSKFCSENILDFLLRDVDIAISHLRIAQVYGEGMREDRIIPVMLRELQRNNTITVYGNGRRVSNFIEVNDLIKKIKFFLEKKISGVFNIGGENIPYLELAKRLIRQHGNCKSKIIKMGKAKGERFYLDCTKFNKLVTA